MSFYINVFAYACACMSNATEPQSFFVWSADIFFLILRDTQAHLTSLDRRMPPLSRHGGCWKCTTIITGVFASSKCGFYEKKSKCQILQILIQTRKLQTLWKTLFKCMRMVDININLLMTSWMKTRKEDKID